MKKSLIIKVYGRVQGVGFRYYTNKTAIDLSIDGFVKNRPDGSVYIEAEGDHDRMNQFLEWVKKGPEWAHVEDVQVQDNQVQDYRKFVVK